MDTQWKGTFRQRLLTVGSPWLLHTAFTHAWVPGPRQEAYARRLGFPPEKILQGLYAVHTDCFHAAWDNSANRYCGAAQFPKRLLYAGRLVPHKLGGLLQAFSELAGSALRGWRLDLIGNGPMASDPLLQHPSVSLRPHTDQDQLAEAAAQGGIFCLCSSDEPWGMVLQEFAAAGMPLLVSKQCGASDLYAQDNSWLCDGRDAGDIRRALIRVADTPPEQLFAMAERSASLGASPDSRDWAAALCAVYKKIPLSDA